MHSNNHATSERVAAIRATLSREFHDFVGDIEHLVLEASSLTGDELAGIKDKLKQRVASAKSAIGDVGESISDQAHRGANAANDYVQEQPWKVVGGAAVIAFLLGLVVARRT